MHISQYTFIIIFFLINTKRHCDSKEKQWVPKRHENALDIRNINLSFGLFSFHLTSFVLSWMDQHVKYSESKMHSGKEKRGSQSGHERENPVNQDGMP